MSSTFLNSGVASRILSAEWATKCLISKITSHTESTRFAFLIKQSILPDVRTSSFSRFSGLIIPREKLLGSEKIVFDWSTPLSFRRPLNLGTRFFQVGASCHIPSLVWPRLASHLCIMFKFHLILKWGFVKPSESSLKMTQIKIVPKRSKEMFMLLSENIGQR